MASQESNLILTVVAGILFGGAAAFCLVWPKTIRDYGLKSTSRNFGRHGQLLIRWMEGPQYLWSIRTVGAIALCAFVLVVAVLVTSRQH
jgi:hypothetical protein